MGLPWLTFGVLHHLKHSTVLARAPATHCAARYLNFGALDWLRRLTLETVWLFPLLTPMALPCPCRVFGVPPSHDAVSEDISHRAAAAATLLPAHTKQSHALTLLPFLLQYVFVSVAQSQLPAVALCPVLLRAG